MAVGDAFTQGPESVANAAYFDIRPGAGTEIVIHNVYVPEAKAVSFEVYDGSNSVVFDAVGSDATRFGMQFHCTNTVRIRVLNSSGGSIYMAADGMYTK